MRSPLVAVVTPVYNGAPYLEETIASVQKQTYPHVIHVILDNASTDNTAAIIHKAQTEARVPIVAHRNEETLPQLANWEASVRLTPPEADYFLVLCADDLLYPSAIERLVAVAERDPDVDVVGCKWVDGVSPDGELHQSSCGLPKDISIFDGRWFVKTYLFRMHFATSPQCQLLRRRVLDKKIPLYANDVMLWDIDVCLAALMGGKYGFVHDVLSFTRIHDQRVTATYTGLNHLDTADWLTFIDRYGRQIMTVDEFQTCRRAYLRYYCRRLLLWRFWQGNRKLFDQHLSILADHGISPTRRDYAEALLDWCWLALRNRRARVGAAPSLWPKAWRELRTEISQSQLSESFRITKPSA